MLGYSSMYIIVNFGMLCWTLFVTPLLYLGTIAFVAFCGKEYRHLKEKMNQKMFFNNWIQFLNETFIFLGMCVALNFYYFSWDSFGNGLNSFCSVIFGLLIVLFPFFIILYYNLPQSKINITKKDSNFLGRYGSVLEGLNFFR